MSSAPTALITGASAGLGAEYARQLARQGYHLILTARRAKRLQALADELRAAYAIQVDIWPADLEQANDLQRLEDQLAALPRLDLLVNNAGFGLGTLFADTPIEKTLGMIQVHVIASVRLTRAALPGMLARRRGGVINVSSVAAFAPLRNTTYSATKAFLVNFSEALQSEIEGSGVRLQALCPGFTYTEFHDTQEFSQKFKRSRIPGWLWLTSEYVIADSLKTLARGPVVCVPGWQYKLAAAFMRTPLTRALVLGVAKLIVGKQKTG